MIDFAGIQYLADGSEVGHSWFIQYGSLLPILVAILLLLISPLINKAAVHTLVGRLNEDARRSGISADKSKLSVISADLPDYLEYVSDFIQVIPSGLLPIVGAVIAVSVDIDIGTTLIVCVLAFLITLTLLLWMITTPPLRYAKKRRCGPYSGVVVFAIIMNFVCATAIGFSIP